MARRPPPPPIVGTNDDDTLNGTKAADVISGLAGNDIINGNKGDDTIDAGIGNDVVHGGSGDDNIYGGGGNDTLYGDDGNDNFHHYINENSGAIDYYDGGANSRKGGDTLIIYGTTAQLNDLQSAITAFNSYDKSQDFHFNTYIPSMNLTVRNIEKIQLVLVNNAAPVANSDAYSVNEDAVINIAAPGLLANDTDAEGNPLTAVVNTGPSHGSLTLNSDGSFTYTPVANFNGSDSFTYFANDGSSNSNLATVSITVNSVNDVPVANTDSYTINEDAPLNVGKIGVLANDTDVDGNTLSAILSTGPAHGTLTLNADGSFSYTPFANYYGSDSFTYTANDGSVNSAPATVNININSVNDAPVGTNNTISMQEDTSHTFTSAEFGFSDPNDSPANALLAVKISSLPGAGSLTNDGIAVLAGDLISAADIDAGKLVFLPAANANGHGYASFTFQVQDSGGVLNGGVDLDQSPNTITIDVIPVNDPPVANSLSTSVDEDGSVPITLSGSDLDGDALSFIAGSPLHGILSGSGANLTYTPNANYNGSDSFTYIVNDGSVDSAPATVSITVNSVNDAPLGTNNTISMMEDTSHTFTSAEFGFSDPNDSPANSLLAVKISSLPGAGSLTNDGIAVLAGDLILVADIDAGKLVFSPAANDNGNGYASFTFQVKDNGGVLNGGVDLDQSPNTITIDVTPVNDPPVANSLSTSVDEDGSVPITLVGSDLDGDTLTFIAGSPLHGILSGSGANLTYTPNANYNGSDSFTYIVNDGSVDSAPATVSITVNSVNDAPLGTNNTISMQEDTSHTFTSAEFGFSDPNDSPANALLAVKISSLPGAGSLTNDGIAVLAGDLISAADIGAGKLVFSPAPNGNGNGYASFTFQVQDNGGVLNGGVDLDQSPNTITINVTPINDPPVASSLSTSVNEDGSVPITLVGSDPDGDTLSFIAGSPLHGILSGNGANLTYTPNANYNGSDSFTYIVNDGSVDSAPATVSITVNSVNDAPVGTNNTISILEDTNHTFTAAEFGFSDPNDSPANALLAVKISSLPSAGSLTNNGIAVVAGDFISAVDISAGKLVFSPSANANGSGYASFTFQVEDNGGVLNGGINLDQSPNNFTIDVTAVNDAPVANNDSYTTTQNIALNIALPGVLANDTDVEGNTLSASLQTGASHGTVTVNSNGSFSYTPASNYSGPDSFTYKANDGSLNSNIATVNITVNPTATNHAPVAVDDYYLVKMNVSLNVAAPGILANDTDQDGNPLIVVGSVFEENGGELFYFQNGALIYTPFAGFVGNDTFTYFAYDGSALSNLATVHFVIMSDFGPNTFIDQYSFGSTYFNISHTFSEAYATAIQGDGLLSLREAITLANRYDLFNDGQTDTIVLNAGVYQLSLSSGGSKEDSSISGDLDITQNLILMGTQNGTSIIDGGDVDRVIQVISGATLNISDLIITNGTLDNDGGGTNGGGILSAGTLIADNIIVTGNSTTSSLTSNGGGIYILGGTATITNSVISNNTAETSGAGIYVANGTVTISDSIIDNNSTSIINPTNTGGGIYLANGNTTISNTDISNNDSYSGGGISIAGGTATITDSTVRDNTATLNGGGINIVGGNVQIANSTINDNTTDGKGGGIYITGTLATSSALITNSTLSENHAGYGGGLFVDSTASPNYFADNLTIANNTVTAFGGGLFVESANTFSISNSIILGNVFLGDEFDPPGPNDVLDANLTTDINNISNAVFAASFSYTSATYASVFGNHVLADNGGPTETIQLIDQFLGNPNPAIDSAIVIPTITDPGTDQRGAVYVDIPGFGNDSPNYVNDIGAYEFGSTPPVVPPVMLDLNHDGLINFVSWMDSVVNLDVNGAVHEVGWTTPEDGVLVYQYDGSSEIKLEQISFTPYAPEAHTDLEALSLAFDSNHNNLLDSQDSAFHSFGTWQDVNNNGLVDSGEYQSLGDKNIISISLVSDNQYHIEEGNAVFGISSYQTNDGSFMVADVGVAIGPVISEPIVMNDVLAPVNDVNLSTLEVQSPQSDSTCVSEPTCVSAECTAPEPIVVPPAPPAAIMEDQPVVMG